MQNVVEFESKRIGPNWKNIAIIASFHLLAIPALFTFSWQNLAALLVGNWIVGSLGVGLGWHRLLTHRGFKAPKWLEYTLSIFATMSIQDPPNNWITTHRMHHAFTDTDKDPHSIRPGFWWAQIGWIVWGTAQDHDEATLKRYIPDLLKDKWHTAISRYFYIPIILSALILVCDRRLDDDCLGRFCTCRRRVAHNLVRQFPFAHLRQTPARYRRPLDQ